MAKTDWKISDKVKPDDMNAIGEEINGLHDGFIKKSIVIPAGEDLNTYMEEGNYYCPANATVASLLNSPTEEAFHLTVEPHAGVLQTLTTFQPGNIEVFQRNYYFGWGAWNKVPTRDELEEILPQANANAQNYADTNFRKPSEIINANLVKNSSALLGFDYWTQRANIFFERFMNQTVGGFFGLNAAVPGGEYAILDNEPIGISPGARYLLQAVFHTSGSYTNTTVHIEVCNTVTNSIIDSLDANPQAWWHRKTKVINIPAGVASIYLRLVVTNAPSGVTKGFARIKFSEIMNNLNQDMPYSDELTTRALYEGVEAAKQSGVDAKNGIVGAINAKGGSASTSDTWPTLISKVNAIQQGAYSVVVPNLNTGAVNLSPNQTGWLYNFASVPANVKTISLMPTNSNAAYWSVRITGSPMMLAFALKDANGLVWQMSPNAYGGNPSSYTINMYSLQVDTVAGIASCLYMESGSMWTLGDISPSSNVGSIRLNMSGAKPAAFDSTRPMTLGILITSTSSNGAASYATVAYNMRLQTT
ncbi:pyocin knob domain-containing protein [Paenibacillus xylanexedens]|uniref:pyocin knob domain-containing protein n=1 Tax=Paenibacillus xylanexedens TaxID=528191 RepID=UPI001C8EABE4|nr:pyocin knob domain-containing protein [Paenibacillus xylanexedens]MBY0117841.1 hypothetical protein [Paenibacillus xylanexedens]